MMGSGPVAIDRDALARSYLPLALDIAAQHGRRYPPLADECESAAFVGLARAIRFARPDQIRDFEAFAAKCIRNEIRDAQREFGPYGYKRDPGSAPTVLPLGREWEPTAPDAGDFDESPLDVAGGLGRGLPPRHLRLLELVYGHAATATLKRAGSVIGVREARACQIHNEAIRMIRDRLGLGGKGAESDG